jgi:hypothetical protein
MPPLPRHSVSGRSRQAGHPGCVVNPMLPAYIDGNYPDTAVLPSLGSEHHGRRSGYSGQSVAPTVSRQFTALAPAGFGSVLLHLCIQSAFRLQSTSACRQCITAN